MSQQTEGLNTLIPQTYALAGGSLLDPANSLFAQARKRARRGQFWSRLTGRSRALHSLKQVRDTCTIQQRHDGGTQPVPVGQILGSESRRRYFDSDFNPLHDKARRRWQNIARARQQGKNLPPVVLVQVGDIYFVKDGHHRISVARALGQSSIDARVTVWQVSGPLPWEAVAQASSTGLGGQILGIRQVLNKRRAPRERGLRRVLSSARGI